MLHSFEEGITHARPTPEVCVPVGKTDCGLDRLWSSRGDCYPFPSCFFPFFLVTRNSWLAPAALCRILRDFLVGQLCREPHKARALDMLWERTGEVGAEDVTGSPDLLALVKLEKALGSTRPNSLCADE